MKKILLFILKFICLLCGSVFYLGSLGGLILCFTDKVNPLAFNIIFTIILFTIGTFLFYITLKKIKYKEKAQSLDNSIQSQLSHNKQSDIVKNDTNIQNQNQTASEQLKITQKQLNTAMTQLNDMITSGNAVKVTVQKSSAQKEILSQMQTSYSDIQVQNDIQILKDCVNLMNTTNNIETFFSRYELAMTKVLALEQAKQAGINVKTSITSDYVMSLKNQADYVLQAAYNKELEEINELKTANGKRNRIDKFISFLSEYQNEFEFSNVYRNIIDNLNSYKKEL